MFMGKQLAQLQCKQNTARVCHIFNGQKSNNVDRPCYTQGTENYRNKSNDYVAAVTNYAYII